MRLPQAFRSIRARLAITYTAVLFGVAFVLVAGLNVALGALLADQRETSTTIISGEILGQLGLPGQIRIDEAVVGAEAIIRQQTIENLFVLSILALLALAPVSLAVGWFVAGRVIRPVERITAVAREISATDLSRRIDLAGPDDELRRLADTFDEMLARLERNARAQRVFVEDASHELRNPLAVLRTTVEVALADPDDREGLRAAAEVTQRASDRMTRTVDDLLAFVRHETRHPDVAPVELGVLVTESCAEYRAVAEQRGLVLVSAAPPGLIVEAEPDALKRALANLLANAVRFAPTGSPVHVGAGRIPGWLWFGVRDFGPGIEPDDQPLVFRRAWRDGHPVRPGNGEGIGLALVRQIAEAHGGTVSISSVPRAGSCFVVWLPTRAEAGPAVELLRDQPDPLWSPAPALGLVPA